MMNPRSSEPFAPVILGLVILVGTPALVTLVPTELAATLTATPLRRAVSALVLIGVVSLWVVSRLSLRAASAVEGAQGGDN